MSANEVTAQQQPAAAAVDAAATPVPTGADAEAVKAADPEAFADAAVEAARLMGVAQKQAAAGVKAALPALPPSAARPSCSPISAVSFAELLPSGEAAGTPLRTTPMHFAAVLPPAPACTPESAPSSALDGLSALRTVPEITPVSLEALRRRAGAGEAQDEVRGRLARLKADLQAAQAKLHTVDRGLAAIAHTPASAATSAASGTPSSGVVGSRQQQWEQRRADSPALGSASFASRMRDGGLSSSPAPAIRAVVEATAPTMAAVIENQPAIMGAAAAAAQQSTPLAPATKRLVRFAADTLLGSSSRQPLRNSTPAMLPMTAAGDLAKVQPSPVVATVAGSQRTPVAAGSATRLTPAVARSVNKPSALRNFDLGSSESEGSSSDDDDDASRMARGTVRGTPHLSAAAVASSLTPRLARGSAPPPTPGTAGLSTTSFSPPEPLALLAIRPLGRPRRAPLLGDRGRRPSESEEREFRRRAAALCIQVSPLFGRSRKGSNGDGA